MDIKNERRDLWIMAAVAVMLVTLPAVSQAEIVGISGPAFNLTAKADYVVTGDLNSVLIWGYAADGGRAQLPGPTLIVNEGDTVTVNLASEIPGQNVSILFPGQENVTASGGVAGLLTQEAVPGGATVSYSFSALRPGTYFYHSGTNITLQTEMGLSGTLIVRPAMGANCAYNDADSCFDREFLFFLSEMDPLVHNTVEQQGVAGLAGTNYLSDYFPTYWWLNGRTAVDTMAADGVGWLPTQPYGAMVRLHPHEKVLMRVVGGNRDMHPFHHHGNHARVIATDGRLLQSPGGAGADLSYQVFTVQSHPGGTVDAIFDWTGQDLGWDIYGTTAADPGLAHTCNGIPDTDPNPGSPGFDAVSGEYCPDHGKPLPIVLPENQNLAFGGFWSGSPFLGNLGGLPPGEGGLNPGGGFPFMWHSHTEKEMTNWDIFPGGMMTMMIVEKWDVPID